MTSAVEASSKIGDGEGIREEMITRRRFSSFDESPAIVFPVIVSEKLSDRSDWKWIVMTGCLCG